MDFNKAMNLANERGYDLILISSGDIPVTKIADYSKMLYEQKKKEKRQMGLGSAISGSESSLG